MTIQHVAQALLPAAATLLSPPGAPRRFTPSRSAPSGPHPAPSPPKSGKSDEFRHCFYFPAGSSLSRRRGQHWTPAEAPQGMAEFLKEVGHTGQEVAQASACCGDAPAARRSGAGVWGYGVGRITPPAMPAFWILSQFLPPSRAKEHPYQVPKKY